VEAACLVCRQSLYHQTLNIVNFGISKKYIADSIKIMASSKQKS
jgi:hypothetical protein